MLLFKMLHIRIFASKSWLVIKQAWTMAWSRGLVLNNIVRISNMYILFPEPVAVKLC